MPPRPLLPNRPLPLGGCKGPATKYLWYSCQVIALVDTDGDGAFSEAEGEAYANAVLRDTSLEVDDEP